MFNNEISAIAKSAQGKINFLKTNPLGYFVAAMLAGMYVGFGIILIYTIGGLLNGEPYTKILMGASFGIALSLVIMAGSELFTGNTMVMTIGIARKTVAIKDAIKLSFMCYLGNFLGAIILAILYWSSGLSDGHVGEFIVHTAVTKMNVEVLPLLVRGILCNILVCLASWSGYKCKSESAKLIMIFWCLFAFITSGFEHSIANMTLLFLALLEPHSAAVSISGYAYNLSIVTVGNIIGGIVFIAIPYYLISKKKEA
ncbi:formate/nitrite transporter family protein [Clostridium vincentii]|uniref:Nitrite transporter NirC n=1 Tax=Clostridium vincentii TaxID=52704 RepID=A0A2T0BEB9_9CLOT|nr:formate/nitrite transporter family protein [Clostridium vincentii]PRR82209.1 Nitrite transporter NirC [Clostridium vincentii]